MMRRFFSAVLEQGNSYTHDFQTEPFEAGWASEARWFIRVLDASAADLTIDAVPQISPDGILWCDDESFAGNGQLGVSAAAPTMISFRQSGFGNWLRLRVALSGDEPNVKLLIYLALKE